MNHLQSFYQNRGERESFKEFQIEVLKKMAWEKSFDGLPVTGIKEARELVDKTFDTLDEMYAKIEEVEIPNSR